MIITKRCVLLPVAFLILLLAAGCPVLADTDADTPNDTSVKNVSRFVVSGVIYDSDSGEPLADATIRVQGTGTAVKANTEGRYRIVLPAAEYTITVSHVGYYSSSGVIALVDSSLARDFRLNTSIIDLGQRRVYTRAYDPAQRIIVEAIRHKQDILSKINDYRFEAYVKLIITDATEPDSTNNIFLITETQLTSFWEQPGKYKEIITARKQSANIPAEGNLVTVGEILNFNRNRLDMGEYDVVSPVAEDALDYYNYYLLDTVYIDERPIFVLEIEPKNRYEPLFVGEIHIADSTFEVVRVDVGFSTGLKPAMLDDARFYQDFAPVGDDHWMPIEIGYGGVITLGIPFPGIPSKLGFSYVASLSDYVIDDGHPDGLFDEYQLIVDEQADDVDSTAWSQRQTIPLTSAELRGYERIDSLESNQPLYRKVIFGLVGAMMMLTVGDHDIFHYNRVEGAYAGLRLNFDRLLPATRLTAKGGYAFEDENWQYRLGVRRLLWERQKLWLGAELHDEIKRRPTIISGPNFNETFYALFGRIDPFDYYQSRGYAVFASVKPLNHFRLHGGFDDMRHTSRTVRTDYAFFGDKEDVRRNVAVGEGTMRTLTARLRYDSRKLIKSKGRDRPGFDHFYMTVEAGVEYSSPDLADSDFDFTRYYLRLDARVRALGLGTTSLFGYAGAAEGDLPPQRLFIADFHDPDFFKRRGMNTFCQTNFGGDRLAQVYVVHDLGNFAFRNSGIGFLKKLPLGLSLHGGALWSRFSGGPYQPAHETVHAAPRPFTEAGFGLTNLTPFLMPFNLSLHFTWQLSAYDTEKFSFEFDLFGF